jgi:hypothetical protein
LKEDKVKKRTWFVVIMVVSACLAAAAFAGFIGILAMSPFKEEAALAFFSLTVAFLFTAVSLICYVYLKTVKR